MDFLRSDLRHACHRLLASPGFALIAITSIALGVGASTAVFGAVHAILLAALPYPQAQRVVALTDRDSEGGRLPVTYGTYREIAERSRSFERLAVADRWQPALVTSAGDPERLDGDHVSADYFRVLGIAPAIGRDFAAADDVRGGPPVAIVSASLAARRLGGAPGALGRPIVLDGATYTVIGVMPEGFRNALAPTAEVWAPLRYRAQAEFQSSEWGHHLRMVGRLAAGIAPARAAAEIQSIGRAPVAEFPRPAWAPMSDGLIVESLLDSMTIGVRPALLAILGAVFLLLAIACVNLSNLLLARTLARRSELAIRTALGAGSAQLLRQLVTESLALALVGGIVGIGVAAAVEALLRSLAPASLARAGAFSLDASVFAVALAVSTLVGLVAGVVPGLVGIHDGTYTPVRAGSHATDSHHRVTRRALVVTQVALAFVLLTSAGLLLRSVEKLLATEPGFDAERVLTMQVVATGRRYGSSAELAQFYEQALDAVRAVPGVEALAFTSQLPLSGDSDGYGVELESDTRGDEHNAGAALRYVVTPDWFTTMRIPLLEGRLLDAADKPGAPQAVLINASFAKRRFGAQSAIGQRLRMGPYIGRSDAPWANVVGVVGDVKQASLALESPDAVYFAMGQWLWVDSVQSLVVRARTDDAAALAPSVERAIWSVDPTPPLVRVATMKDLLEASESQRSFALVVFAAFALTAVVLAVVGLYGVVARSVEERKRELGVRAALGASPGRVAALVIRQGMALAGAGIVVGVLGAVGASRALSSLLFGVNPLDALAFGGTIAVLAGVSLLACGVPAARAARVDPAITLRSE
jgi:putative ABC transport system permease protein